MYIKEVSWAKMVGNTRYWEYEDIPVYVILKNICEVVQKLALHGIRFFIRRGIKPKFGVKPPKKEPYWCYQLVCRISDTEGYPHNVDKLCGFNC